MPSFNLSSVRSQSGGLGQQASPTLLSPTAQVVPAQVNPSAGRQSFTPVKFTRTSSNIGKSIGNAFAKAAQSYSDTQDMQMQDEAHLMKAAEDFQDRENQVMADDMVSNYRIESKKLFYGSYDSEGNVVNPGYSHTEGTAAAQSYGAYEEALESLYQDTIGSMSPVIQEKALLSMMSSKEGLINMASIHRSNQLGVAEERQKMVDRNNLKADLVTNNSLLGAIDPMSGLTFEDQFNKTASNPLTAKTEFNDFLVNAMGQIYIEQGLTNAKAFANEVLIKTYDSPRHTVTVRTAILEWEHQAEKDFNSNIITMTKQTAAADKQRHDANYLKISADRINGKTMSQKNVTELALSGGLSTDQLLAYENEAFNGKTRTTDAATLINYEKQIEAYASNGYVDENDNNVKYSFLGDPNLSSAAEQRLLSMTDNMLNPDYRGKYKQVMEQMDAWTKPPGWMEDIYDQKFANQRALISREVRSRLGSGESPDSVLASLETKYQPEKLVAYELPPMRSTNTRPETIDDLRGEVVKIQIMFQEGIYTASEAQEQASLLLKYSRTITGANLQGNNQ